MNKAIKVYIVEDMAISRASLESMLLKNKYQVVGSSAKAEIAWEDLQKMKADILLLDINLAGNKNGIWLAEQVRKKLQIPIVYLTAYGDQRTLKEVIATKPNGYLMKPYQEATLITTISIALQNFFDKQEDVFTSEDGTTLKNVIYIKDKFVKVKLQLADICFIKSDGNYLEIQLEEKTHLVRSRLCDFKKLLPATLFCQTHQRYIININKVAVLGKDFLTIKGVDIPISAKYKAEVEAIFPLL